MYSTYFALLNLIFLARFSSNMNMKHLAVHDALRGRDALMEYAPTNLATMRAVHALNICYPVR
ncbi:hypothetical protein BDV37DRAFT_235129 [Aspergillus pseudonomiae]|uniref:Uncharacterized protein n=1 Tax=Aspergillus pseudonomiae TaxID=1506151 RepID=A0A5N7DUV4_9EURO|nr:uncharacterized protein BDV37DRAFT_235129 [Aspergillus pseudonomiae]KAE8409809.1 hypothetical protein BDV37DRAFT_235129 [Aspergillus pseudonomiae]